MSAFPHTYLKTNLSRRQMHHHECLYFVLIFFLGTFLE